MLSLLEATAHQNYTHKSSKVIYNYTLVDYGKNSMAAKQELETTEMNGINNACVILFVKDKWSFKLPKYVLALGSSFGAQDSQPFLPLWHTYGMQHFLEQHWNYWFSQEEAYQISKECCII